MPEHADPAPSAPGPTHAPAAPAAAAAPTSLAQFTALGGPTSEDVVTRMQERVGNQATAAWLSSAAPPGAPARPDPDEERPT